jgi:hypothetical protein
MELTFPHRPFPRWERPLFLISLLFLAFATLLTLSPRPSATQLTHPAVRLPLSFVPNTGQAHAAIHFQAQHAGAGIAFTADGLLLSLPAPGNRTTLDAAGRHGQESHEFYESERGEAAVVQLRFVGSSAGAEWQGEGTLPGRANYLTGNDPAGWQTGLPTYATVVQHNIYPGVDLRYSGQPGHLLTEWTITPALTRPETISWHYQGAAVHLDAAGGLVVGDGLLTQAAPLAWQVVNGEQLPVGVGYNLTADNLIHFRFTNYDPSHPLHLQAPLAYQTESAREEITAIAVDPVGNTYVAGWTTSSNLPMVDAYQPIIASYGHEEAFVAKLAPDGATLLYSTYLGGQEADQATGITLDSTGRIIVVGSTGSADFPTQNPLQSFQGGYFDVFVTILSADGSTLDFSTYLGGSDYDNASAVALDTADNLYVAGATGSFDFPTTAAAWQPVHSGGLPGSFDAFLAKLDTSGNSLAFGTYLGGFGSDTPHGLAVGSDDTPYLVGTTESDDFPTMNPFQAAPGEHWEAFVTRFTADGTNLIYSTYLGGSDLDEGYGIALDSADRIYVTGRTSSPDFPGADTSFGSGGIADAFVTRLTADGTAIEYGVYIGGNDYDTPFAIALDEANNAYIAGFTSSLDFPTLNAVQANYGGGPTDGFLTKLAADGSALAYSTYLGGSGHDYIYTVVADESNRAHVAGAAYSANFPTTAGSFQPAYAGGVSDAFISRLSTAGNTLEYSTYYGGNDVYPGPTDVQLSRLSAVEATLLRWLPYLLLLLGALPFIYAAFHTAYQKRK